MTTAAADLSPQPAAPIARTRPRSRSARRPGRPAVAPVSAAQDRSPCRVSADVMAVLAAFGFED